MNEVFLSIQGEGRRAGEASVFLRFSGCNLTCSKDSEGFDCDTEFTSGRTLTKDQVVAEVKDVAGQCNWVVFTGGEPALQLDAFLVDALKHQGFRLAIETNGTVDLPEFAAGLLDFITVSPKTAEHTLRYSGRIDELRYVRCAGQAIPKPRLKADYLYLSPAFDGPDPDPQAIRTCVDLVKSHPEWRLSVQGHKFWKVR